MWFGGKTPSTMLCEFALQCSEFLPSTSSNPKARAYRVSSAEEQPATNTMINLLLVEFTTIVHQQFR